MKKVVINKTTKQVLRFGYCDFENDGQYNPATEEILESGFVFDPCICMVDWYWNSTTEEYQQTPPE